MLNLVLVSNQRCLLAVRIYMYDGAFPDRGVMSSFSGHVVGSFYIKVWNQSHIMKQIYNCIFVFDSLMI